MADRLGVQTSRPQKADKPGKPPRQRLDKRLISGETFVFQPQAEDHEGLNILEIVKTRENSGFFGYDDIQNQMRGGGASAAQLQVLQGPPSGPLTIAVYVEGEATAEASPDPAAKEGGPAAGATPKPSDFFSAAAS